MRSRRCSRLMSLLFIQNVRLLTRWRRLDENGENGSERDGKYSYDIGVKRAHIGFWMIVMNVYSFRKVNKFEARVNWFPRLKTINKCLAINSGFYCLSFLTEKLKYRKFTQDWSLQYLKRATNGNTLALPTSGGSRIF